MSSDSVLLQDLNTVAYDENIKNLRKYCENCGDFNDDSLRVLQYLKASDLKAAKHDEKHKKHIVGSKHKKQKCKKESCKKHKASKATDYKIKNPNEQDRINRSFNRKKKVDKHWKTRKKEKHERQSNQPFQPKFVSDKVEFLNQEHNGRTSGSSGSETNNRVPTLEEIGDGKFAGDIEAISSLSSLIENGRISESQFKQSGNKKGLLDYETEGKRGQGLKRNTYVEEQEEILVEVDHEGQFVDIEVGMTKNNKISEKDEMTVKNISIKRQNGLKANHGNSAGMAAELDLDYADDVGLLFDPEHTQKMLDDITEWSRLIGLKVSAEKTKFMVINYPTQCL
ncbi:hypothetical protein QYM36_004650 [Artemia franciscana]|uniref:Uncharacterized protein n=1 Tax=Artemia franciscana TaxID=6661 RepID=A0AA88LGK9_ARTSF|nr:hypothetical protein QYM36_004650 [Artemia franciscana]